MHADNPSDPLFDRLSVTLHSMGVDSIASIVILGSGLSGCFDPHELALLPESLGSTVPGHIGRLGVLNHRDGAVLVSLGRRHRYEGASMMAIQETVHAAAMLGARGLVVTNAAGGLNHRFRVGDIMLITDILSFLLGRCIAGDFAPMLVHETPNTSLNRVNNPGPFTIECYDAVERAAMHRGIRLERGIYAGVMGPSYETRAEIRMLRRAGADAVGMSTIPEVAAARRYNMRVVGASLITNEATEAEPVVLDHGDVVEQGLRAVTRMRVVIDACLDTLR